MLLKSRAVKTLLFSTGFIIGFVPFLASAKMAGGQHASAGTIGKADTADRREALPELRKTDAELLSYYFSTPLRVMDQKFKAALPAALTASMEEKNPSQISKILTELFGTQSPKEVEDILKSAEALKAAREKKQAETQVNSTSNHLLDRLILSSKKLLGKKIDKLTQDEKEYLAQFTADAALQQKKNEQTIAKRDEAINADTTGASRKEAKDWLRNPKNINPDQVMAFISAQIRAGNNEDAVKWFRAMGWDESGVSFADFKNGGRAVRLFAGKTDEEIVAALQAYEAQAPENARLHGLTFNQEPHQSAFETYGAKGQVAKGSPKTAKTTPVL